MSVDIEITSPANNATVGRTFCVTGVVSPPAAPAASPATAVNSSVFVKCIIHYEDESTHTHDEVEVSLLGSGNWSYQMTQAPATGSGEVAGLVAYVLDGEGIEEGDPFGPVDLVISSLLPGQNCSQTGGLPPS